MSHEPLPSGYKYQLTVFIRNENSKGNPAPLSPKIFGESTMEDEVAVQLSGEKIQELCDDHPKCQLSGVLYEVNGGNGLQKAD